LYLLAADGGFAAGLGGYTSNSVFAAVGHSVDGRYLSYYPYGAESGEPLTLIDLEAVRRTGRLGPEAEYQVAQQVSAAAWSPAGHRLAVAGTAGLRVIDLDTGQTHWLDFSVCEAVSWFPPPGS
jgi:hypothetical protein